MAAIDDLHFRLLVIALLLDAAARDVREVGVAPVSGNVHSISHALASIHEVLRAIHVLRPDLQPARLPPLAPAMEA